jgi:hypothetical protein
MSIALPMFRATVSDTMSRSPGSVLACQDTGASPVSKEAQIWSAAKNLPASGGVTEDARKTLRDRLPSTGRPISPTRRGDRAWIAFKLTYREDHDT